MPIVTPVPIPTSYDMVEIRGRFATFDGTPLNGTITFTAAISWQVAPAAATILLATPLTGKVVAGTLFNAAGTGPMKVFATDDPDVVPGGWQYSVKETFDTVGGRPDYRIDVPLSALAAGLELWQVAPSAPAPTPGVSYVVLPAFIELQARVGAVEQGVVVVDVAAGAAFPARPTARMVIWRAPTDPKTAGVAVPGDQWIKTP